MHHDEKKSEDHKPLTTGLDKNLLARLNKINPNRQNSGNCHWCAIEAAKILLNEQHAATMVPAEEEMESSKDPIQSMVAVLKAVRGKRSGVYELEYQLDSTADASDRFLLYLKKKLKSGQVMLASLENNEIDHSYVIYCDNNEYWLVDADRNVMSPLRCEQDFTHAIEGWEGIDKLNYRNGDTNENKNPTINILLCKLASNDYNFLPKMTCKPVKTKSPTADKRSYD